MPIRILPSDLSSQISAGEIIERPASVVKEIIENSIDAGSKNINIIVENSGFQSIILKDDGCGIDKKDLLLAVCHHATSKINSLSDLDKLTTFGFRGEALASIRAVSRLTLISCTRFNDVAAKIYLEGFCSKNIILQPIAHPEGTTIIVDNLFYNIPVRLKFLKNKKLEFSKICEVVKKIALSHFYINFSLKHNNKLITQYNSINNRKNKINRLKDIFDTLDTSEFLEIKEKKYRMVLFGWISHPYNFKKIKNIQYCYVNNRYLYNNIFVNAVRAAYSKIEQKKNISFVLYLTIESFNIDINIHPTKNEIKFHNPDVVYTFIYEAVFSYLKKIKEKYYFNFSCKKQTQLNKEKEFYFYDSDPTFLTLISSIFFKKKQIFKNIKNKIKHNNFISKSTPLEKYESSIGRLLIIIHKYYGLIYHDNNFLLLSFPVAKGIVRKQKLKNNIQKENIIEYFLSNIKINLTSQEYLILFNQKEILSKFGFHLIFKKKYVILSSIPAFLKKCNFHIIISNFFAFLFLKKQVFISDIVDWFYINVFIELKNWTYIRGIEVLLEIEYYCPLLLINPPSKLLQKININAALCILKI
ncbi:DNA mismatch repair endonuclease MutL [Buchnera aphidicola]|uniref:DNA mismatch repair protein MutL n=1 Tax=Buchnera aphidicola subsp. Acyrthosiphon pisum (strain Tuc7) TaxID=561501 RepID=MUTL_BUCAT|nr:DNA mismatch repair endonuclease MutL [Buchnera aphidicola]B8D891.1 RecName: Full=DNA mismatch repair protein MutL [Buchnera aphidicola str. Tuc7 (Acyrthosiphon pisum)]ACL30356.1 DNA mismatch repair protein MutL [Buchnera aphidicola str. Tuc7 (Acyrthosiphon pisum)]